MTTRPEPRIVRPTTAEVQRLIQAPDLTLRFMILCAAEAGLRYATAQELRVCDVREGRIRRVSKQGMIVDMPVSPRLMTVMASVPPGTSPSSEARFIDLLEGVALKQPSTTLHHRFNRWKKKCSVRHAIHFHDLRRDLAHRLYERTRDLRQVQAMLSHSNLNSTFYYLTKRNNPVTTESLALALTDPSTAAREETIE